MNSIGTLPYDAVKWCWYNGIEVYSEPSSSRKGYFRIVVDMDAIDIKISEGVYSLNRVDSKVWEVYVDIYLKGVST